MKKWIAVFLCMVMLAGCMPASAMTTEDLIVSVLDHVFSPGRITVRSRDHRGNDLLAMECTVGENRNDETAFEFLMTEDGETGIAVTSDGLFLVTEDKVYGVRMQDVLDELPALLGLPAVEQQDIDLLATIGQKLVFSFTDEAVTVKNYADKGGFAFSLSIQVDAFLQQLDSAVCALLDEYAPQLDDLLGRWQPVLADLWPDMPATAAGLKQAWKSVDLNALRLGDTAGVKVSWMTLINVYELELTLGELKLDAEYRDGHLHVWAGEEGDAQYGFDTRDFVEIGQKLLQVLRPHLKADAWDVKLDPDGGHFRVNLSLLMDAVSGALRDLLDLHRPWLTGMLYKYENTLELFGVDLGDLSRLMDRYSAQPLLGQPIYREMYAANLSWRSDNGAFRLDGVVGPAKDPIELHLSATDDSLHITTAGHVLRAAWDDDELRCDVMGEVLNFSFCFDDGHGVLSGTYDDGNDTRHSIEGQVTVDESGLVFNYADGVQQLNGMLTLTGDTVTMSLADHHGPIFTTALGLSDEHVHFSLTLPDEAPVLFDLSLSPALSLRMAGGAVNIDAQYSDDRVYLHIADSSRRKNATLLLVDVSQNAAALFLCPQEKILLDARYTPGNLFVRVEQEFAVQVSDVTSEYEGVDNMTYMRIGHVVNPYKTQGFVQQTMLQIATTCTDDGMEISVKDPLTMRTNIDITLEKNLYILSSVEPDEWVSLQQLLEME